MRRSQSDFDRASRVNGAVLSAAQPAADDLPSRTVDEIPVVDEGGVRHVEVVDAAAHRVIAGLEGVDEHQERERAFLVDARAEELYDLCERRAAALPADRSDTRQLDADEPVALAVLDQARS